MPELTWSQMKSEAADQGFEPFPVGTHNFKVDGSKIATGKGSNQIQLRLVAVDGPYANRSLITRLVPVKNNGETNGMFFAQLAALGFTDQWAGWQQMEAMGFDQGLEWLAPQLINKLVTCVVDHQPYNGEMRDNVTRMKPYTGTPQVGPGMVPVVPGAPTPHMAPQPAPAASPPAPAPQAPAPVAAPPQPAAPPTAPVAAPPVAAPPAAPPAPPVAAPAPPAPPQPEAAPAAPVAAPAPAVPPVAPVPPPAPDGQPVPEVPAGPAPF